MRKFLNSKLNMVKLDQNVIQTMNQYLLTIYPDVQLYYENIGKATHAISDGNQNFNSVYIWSWKSNGEIIYKIVEYTQ